MEPREGRYSREKDELRNAQKHCSSSKPVKTSPKRTYGRRVKSKGQSLSCQGNMASSWPTSPLYRLQCSPGSTLQPSGSCPDQVEEMEVDHLHDPGQQRRENITVQRPNSLPQLQQKIPELIANQRSPPSETHCNQQSTKSKIVNIDKQSPVFIILHVNRIELQNQVYPAISPVKISRHCLSFNTEDDKSSKTVTFHINCSEILKVQTSFTSPPFTISITFYNTMNCKSDDKDGTRNQTSLSTEVIVFYLSYEKEVPKETKDSIQDLFSSRLGVLGSRMKNSADVQDTLTGAISTLERDCPTANTSSGLVSQSPGLKRSPGHENLETTPENMVRKRPNQRSLSMLELQRRESDPIIGFETKIARRCLSSEFDEVETRMKCLEREAAEYQLLAAQRRLRVHVLEEQVQTKEREMEHLRRNIQENSSSLTSLVDHERRRCSEFEHQLSQERSVNVNLRDEIRRLQSTITSYQLSMDEKHQAILVRDEQLQQLRNEVNDFVRRDENRSEVDHEQLLSDLDHARREAAAARTELERKQSEHLGIIRAKERLESENSRLKEEIDDKNHLLSEFDHVEDLERLVEALRHDLVEEEDNSRKVNEDLSLSQSREEELQQTLLDVRQQLQDSINERDTVVQERDDVSREAELCQQRLQQCELNLRLAQIALDESRQTEPRDWVIDRDEIVMSGDTLGIGAWGRVKVGKFRGTDVAVKQIHQLILSPHNRRLFEREMTIASRCRHPCLLQFIGATCDDGSPLFVTEILETDLRKLLTHQALEKSEIIMVSLDISRALSYLHGSKPSPIIHRDISSSNVLLWKERNRWRAKLSDYGAANFMRLSMSCNPGASLYSSPEAGTSEQTPKLDVFSFGILLCEMCIRELPLPSQRKEQITRISSQRCKALVNQCIEENPEHRPTASDLVDILLSLQSRAH